MYIIIYSAPNASEFAQSLADLQAEYNGSIPGSEIPAAFIREGSFWVCFYNLKHNLDQ